MVTHIPEISRQVAADLGDADAAGDAEPVVRRLLAALEGGTRVGPAELLRLRQEGAAAARTGRPLATPIDAYLSSAWVTWEHAVALAGPADTDALAALGSALLRAGDDIVAALADGYTAAERALAMSAGAANQEVLDELLRPPVGGPAAAARLARRATLTGLDPSAAYAVLVLRRVGELGVEPDLVGEVARRLARDPARRSHLVAARDGDLVAIASGPWRTAVAFREITAGLPGDPEWWAVTAGPMTLDALASAYSAAIDALRVVPFVASPRSVTPIAAVSLERALVADPVLAAAAVERWLSPIAGAPRGGAELLATVAAWLESSLSVVATARALGVAPRTVSYRLGRVARLLDVPELGPDVRARLSAALLVRRLLTGASIRR